MNGTKENGDAPTQKNVCYAANPNAADLDKDTEEKLRGDAIGDTMYSQSFVLKTLLQLSDVKWNQELEDDLCALWDMSVEKDVCAYLFELCYPKAAAVVVSLSTEGRLIEIVVGILANIFCAHCEMHISPLDLALVLRAMESDDPLVLLQVARLIKALSLYDDRLLFFTAGMMAKFVFILANSLNIALLTNCLDTLAALSSNDEFIKHFLSPQLYDACLIAYRTITDRDGNDDLLFESSEMQNVFTHLMTIITGFCTYFDETQDRGLLEKMMEKNECFLGEVKKVLQFYANDFNLLPITDSFKFFIQSFGYSFPILCVGYDGDVFKELMTIVITLIENNGLETDDFSDLLCYLVSNADLEQLRADSEKLDEKDVVMVLDKFRSSLEACDNETCKQILSIYSNK